MQVQAHNNYPKISNKLAILFVPITTVIMCYSYLIPVIPILIFFGMWLPLSFYKKTLILRPSAALLLTIAIPLLCFISFIWSNYPMRSLYAGVQFLVMAICILIIARTVNFKVFLQGLTMGVSLTLILTLMYSFKTYGSSTLSQPLAGLFGSKNQVGFVSIIGIYIATILLFSDIEKYKKVIFSLFPLGICIISLILSHSITSVISIIFTFCVIIGAWIVTLFPKQLRAIALFLVILYLATITTFIVALDFDVFSGVLNAFGKDYTLTGRTYLWSEGIKHGMLSPILGHGYNAFWVPYNPPAEQYWDEFFIVGKTGFNFHNLYIEAFVILGIVGVIAVAVVMLYLFYSSFYLIINNGLNITTCTLFGISSLMLIRSISEVEIFGPFGLQCLIFYSLIPRLIEYKIR